MSYYTKTIKLLVKLNKFFPKYSLGRHIGTSMDGHCIENLSDKEFYNALNDYVIELESDVVHEEDVEDIVKDGMNLNKMFLEEEEE